MKKIFFLLLCLISVRAVFATHNRAGEITYRRISSAPGVYTYEATIVTYTNTYQTQADRNYLMLYWGDGDSLSLQRMNGPDLNSEEQPGSGPDLIPDGEFIAPYTKKNIYIGKHSYPGPGNYCMSMSDQNRNDGILNIPGSVNVPFFIETCLEINSILGQDNSPILLNPPIDKACQGECFYHNPGAYDPDGDSLSYELTQCLTTGGVVIPGYTYPPTTSVFSIDAYTGELTWCAPPIIGVYNLGILVKEWRGGYEIGSVERDMQINVVPCQDHPPVITPINDTCIEAGKTLNVAVSVNDPDNDDVTLTATGGPLTTNFPVPEATFNPVTGFVPLTTYFSWPTACNDVKEQPYEITFKADDNHATSSTNSYSLVDFATFRITVVGPPPQSPSANPSGSNMILKWDAGTCSLSTLNQVIGYKIYRHVGFTGWKHGPCETGVPAYTGYVLIGSTSSISDTTYTDSNNGQGLLQATDYCYMVVAEYADGSQSYASEEFCNKLLRDVPIITNVSVDSTDKINGSITVKWLKPLADSLDFDTIKNPGPYEFKLMQAQGFTGALTYNQIASFTSPSFSGLTANSFTATALNTVDNPYSYRIDFYATSVFKNSSNTASSVYLSITPTDKKLILSWQEYVPWDNYNYYIYRKNSSGVFVLHDSSTTQTYTDKGLTNGSTYCYKIMSVGKYTDTTIVSPLINFSEEACGSPIDLIPPCPPNLTVSGGCSIGQDSLTWTNPNHYCADDVIFYRIYYVSIQGDSLSLLTKITNLSDTTYIYNNPSSIAGCFAVTAVDSFLNESHFSQIICVDNCPNYKLPNVFSPNGDGNNDLFTPVLPYKYVKDIDIKIYDRWGLLVFESTDPNINWDGKDQSTKKLCDDGVYFYVCKVDEIRLTGIKPNVLTGNIQLYRNK